ncbi:MAG: hypothetical protein KGL35_08590 [Bradyrhizobium sp.]|nr:hypothetical protein [Bradyrhizobium sp.]
MTDRAACAAIGRLAEELYRCGYPTAACEFISQVCIKELVKIDRERRQRSDEVAALRELERHGATEAARLLHCNRRTIYRRAKNVAPFGKGATL